MFVGALYRSAPSDSLVEVRFRVGSGMDRRFFDVAGRDGVVEEVVSLADRTDVFVGVVPRRRRGGGRADLVQVAGVAWVDCDSDESVAAVAAFRPRPTMQVASGSARHRHAYWALRDAVVLHVVEDLNRPLASELGADARCSDAPRILRPAGSANWKSGRPTAVRLIALEEQRSVDVAELAGRLPALPTEPVVPRQRSVRPAAGEDRLLALPPRVYVERLLGSPVGRDGKVRCPVMRTAPRVCTCMRIRGVAGIAFRAGRAARSMTSLRCCSVAAPAARSSSSCVASLRRSSADPGRGCDKIP